MRRVLTRALAPTALAALLLAGCAAERPPVAGPALARLEALGTPQISSAIDVYDPLEGLNRGIYVFNARFDELVFLPLVYTYGLVTPDLVEERIKDFFSNLTEISSLINSLLQLKLDHAGRAAHRLFVNSTIGLLGFIDIATILGYPQEREDFGQTLGVWGVGEGPFIVLPLLGPSNLRDTAGLLADAAPSTLLLPQDISEDPAYLAGWYGLRPIDTRRSIAFRYYQTGSPFEYDGIRLLYTQKRRLDIQR